MFFTFLAIFLANDSESSRRLWDHPFVLMMFAFEMAIGEIFKIDTFSCKISLNAHFFCIWSRFSVLRTLSTLIKMSADHPFVLMVFAFEIVVGERLRFAHVHARFSENHTCLASWGQHPLCGSIFREILHEKNCESCLTAISTANTIRTEEWPEDVFMGDVSVLEERTADSESFAGQIARKAKKTRFLERNMCMGYCL